MDVSESPVSFINTNTLPCKKETNMMVVSIMTRKIGLIYRHMKTIYIYVIIIQRETLQLNHRLSTAEPLVIV